MLIFHRWYSYFSHTTVYILLVISELQSMKEVSTEPEVRFCPVCGVKINDILKHLRLRHRIENTGQLEREVDKIVQEKKKRKEFAAYVDELKVKIRNNEITHAEYRKLITEWTQESGR